VKQGVGKDQKKFGEKECIFCTARKVEIEKHFIMECEAFKDSKDNYVNILTASFWDNLFNEGTIEKLGALIVTLHRKRDECRNQMAKHSVP